MSLPPYMGGGQPPQQPPYAQPGSQMPNNIQPPQFILNQMGLPQLTPQQAMLAQQHYYMQQQQQSQQQHHVQTTTAVPGLTAAQAFEKEEERCRRRLGSGSSCRRSGMRRRGSSGLWTRTNPNFLFSFSSPARRICHPRM